MFGINFDVTSVPNSLDSTEHMSELTTRSNNV